MAVTVKLRHLRHSARKLQPYTRLIAGKNLDAAIMQTAVMPQDSAKFINKALLMARDAAKNKEFDTSTLMVKEIFATIGPKIKRIRANARGRANSYKKHLAHLQVTVDVTPDGTSKAGGVSGKKENK